MTYTIDQLISIDTSLFGKMKPKELSEVMETLKAERKERTKKHITPLVKEHVKPVQDKHIKPKKEEHIKPIDKIIKELKTYMPKPKPRPAYITINGKRYGPFNSKKDIAELITEVETEEEEQ